MTRPVTRLSAVLSLVLLAACSVPQTQGAAAPGPSAARVETELTPAEAAQNFISVAQHMEPEIERECQARTRGRSCDYQIMVDDRPGQEPNAFQTEDRQGRPILAFNLALIASVRNQDELAFVMGHEAAHFIMGHLDAKAQDAAAGAVIMGVLAAASGADARGISQAQDIGAEVGGRAYSKDYELEADRLGTILTWDAGYDPLRGAEFFRRLPDPGNVFLGTHPANGLRLDIVRRTVAQLKAGTI